MMARAVLYGSATILFLMLLKDGKFGRLVNDAARGTRDFGQGIKPITTIV